MTPLQALAAVLAMLLPPRGRHRHGPDDTVTLPRVPGWDGGPGQSDEKTRLDLSRARPYVRPADEDGDEYRGWLP